MFTGANFLATKASFQWPLQRKFCHFCDTKKIFILDAQMRPRLNARTLLSYRTYKCEFNRLHKITQTLHTGQAYTVQVSELYHIANKSHNMHAMSKYYVIINCTLHTHIHTMALTLTCRLPSLSLVY